jgi:hypothetical protein
MKYDPSNKILTMSQTELEHCGFNWDNLNFEMELAGMDEAARKEAADAFVIVVSMHRGLYKCE